MKASHWLGALLLTVISFTVLAQDIPYFTTDFKPEEFAARRAKVYDAIGTNGVYDGCQQPDQQLCDAQRLRQSEPRAEQRLVPLRPHQPWHVRRQVRLASARHRQLVPRRRCL